MQQVKGYVFSAEFEYDRRKLMFGRDLEGNPTLFEERLLCYETKEDVIENARRFLNQDNEAKKLEVYNLDLRYAENETDLKLFENESNLVVMLMLDEKDSSLYSKRILIGPIVSGRGSMAPAPGAKLRDNGYQTFTKKGGRSAFERALYCWSEVKRQGDFPCAIGQLKIKKILTIKEKVKSKRKSS